MFTICGVFYILSIFILISVLKHFRELSRSPLRHIPGPFIARFTNIWRFIVVYNRKAELVHQELHEKHGVVVRLGPNTLSLSDPKLLPTIYNFRGDFIKSSFYNVGDTMVNGNVVSNLFSTTSNQLHSQALRPIHKLYHMTSLLAIETQIDTTISLFCQCLDEKFALSNRRANVCSIDKWLLFFAWDVIGQITFSTPMGFLARGCDITGTLTTSEKTLDYFAVVGQIPKLDYWLAKNGVLPLGPRPFDHAAATCVERYLERQAKGVNESLEPKDMLDQLINLRKANLIDENAVVRSLLANFIAGADTTAIWLRAIIYYVLKNPHVKRKLVDELDTANLEVPISYASSKRLPYLDAVITEAMRIHPAVGLCLERVVPDCGLTLTDGTTIPPGTVVGMNAWVINRNKQVFGQDADIFNPERWLRNDGETAEHYGERLGSMKRSDLSFGMGNRVCLGKNLSMLETYKVIATMFKLYDINLVDQEKEWQVQNSWFVRQSGIDVRLSRRD